MQPDVTHPPTLRHVGSRARPARYEPLAIVLVAAATGISIDRGATVGWGLWWFVAASAWGLWLVLWKARFDRIAAIVLLVSTAALAGAWHHACWRLFSPREIGRYAEDAPRPAALEMVALGGPRRIPAPPSDPLRAIPTGDRSRLSVCLTAIRDRERWLPAAGRSELLVEGHLLDVRAGDRLMVFGQLARPRGAENPGGFDFAQYVRRERVLGVVRADFPDCVKVLSHGTWWSPRRLLDDLRRGGDRWLWQSLGRERSGLAAALLLGSRDQLDDERSDAFLKTGTVHVLAISGMHIAILASALFFSLRLGLLPRRAALAGVAVLIVLYTILTDMQPSAVRAAMLVLLMCIAQAQRRPTSAVNCLAGAALAVLIWNPADLFSVGAQLSFLAVATLIWFAHQGLPRPASDPLARLIASTRPWPRRAARWVGSWTARVTLAGAAVWGIALPLVMARFHLLSPAAVVLTTLTWLPAGLALLSGFGLLTVGWLAPPLGWVLARICDGSLAVLDWLVTAAADLPGSHLWVPGPSGWWLCGLYGGLGLWWGAPHLRPPRRWIVALLAGWIALGVAGPRITAAFDRQPRAECVFLSVGHGCAAVLHLPDGRTMLYDAGSLGSPRGAAQSIAGYLWSRGITHLDAVVVSHADVDHYNALPDLLERFSVGVAYVSPVMFESRTAALDTLRDALDRAGVEVRELHGGQQLRIDGGELRALHPPRRGVLGSDNANSIVLELTVQGRRVLLTGDLETPGLEALLAESPRDCDLLLAPHHGSRLSDPPGMAGWCRPDWVLISGGHADVSQPVEQAYRAAGAEVLHTAKRGAVRCTIAGGALEVDCWRDHGW
jgi:competence protein ComEC